MKETCLIFFLENSINLKINLLKNYQKKGICRNTTGNIQNLDGVPNQMSTGARPKTKVSSFITEYSGWNVMQ